MKKVPTILFGVIAFVFLAFPTQAALSTCSTHLSTIETELSILGPKGASLDSQTAARVLTLASEDFNLTFQEIWSLYLRQMVTITKIEENTYMVHIGGGTGNIAIVVLDSI